MLNFNNLAIKWVGSNPSLCEDVVGQSKNVTKDCQFFVCQFSRVNSYSNRKTSEDGARFSDGPQPSASPFERRASGDVHQRVKIRQLHSIPRSG
jgi:hypothetical protein